MRFTKRAAGVLLCACLLCGRAAAGPAERAAVQRALAGAAPGSAAVVNPATGVLEAARGLDEPLPSTCADTAEAVLAWLRDRADALGLDPDADELVLERSEPLARGGWRVLARQRWRGLLVAGGEVRCVVSATGRLRSLASACVPDLAPPEREPITAGTARARAAEALGATLAAGQAEARLWVRRRADGDRLEWEVRVPLWDGRTSSTWLDASSGRVLSLDESAVFAIGLVFPTDPRSSEAEVPLSWLLPGQGLTSRAFAVEDQSGPRLPPLGPGDDYRYPSTSAGFDQVNAYWHVDRFLHDFLGPLGYAGPPESLIVRVHSPLEPAVALTSGRYVLLGLPIAGQLGEVSRCHDIVYHELGHAVLFGAGIQSAGGGEAGSFHEAIGDYLAAACTGDPAIGEWLYLQFPQGGTRVDQPVDPWHTRNLERVAFGAAPVGSAWANGMILSSALWDLRARLGRTADSLVLESLDHLPGVPAWSHFANALLQADLELHGGRAAGAIVEALSGRGVRGAAVAEFTGPARLEPAETGEFRARPCCGGVAGEPRWRARPWCRGGPCGEWRSLGEGPVLRAAFDEDSELELEVRTPWGDTLVAGRFVSVREPELHLDGPARLALGERATWRARVSAMGPWRAEWRRLWRRAGALPERLGSAPEIGFAMEAPCELSVTVTDGIGRTVTSRLEVQAFADRPPGEGPAALAVGHRLDAGAPGGELRVSMGRAGRLRAEVYDVRGRARLLLWDGAVARGAHVVRWDARGLEPGVYLLRVRFEDEGALERFIVLR
jgi:hypothetical protein